MLCMLLAKLRVFRLDSNFQGVSLSEALLKLLHIDVLFLPFPFSLKLAKHITKTFV